MIWDFVIAISGVWILMRVRPSTVYKLVRTGALPAVHLGRIVRVPAEALEQWLAAGGWRGPTEGAAA